MNAPNRFARGAEVVLPQYEYSGRAAHENNSEEELEARNAKLRDLVPFRARKKEFDEAIVRRDLQLTRSRDMPDDDEPVTVKDWGSGDRYGESFVSFGQIIRYDEPRVEAALRLGWARYEGGDRLGSRQLESEAVYTVNDVEVGQGVAGFTQAMKRLAALPAGSVVQVRACLRTKGPFTCPLTYEGHRHFERTGFEPYFGMFPWLIDVAKLHQIEIQWVPDEQQSCCDCELNR